MKKLSLAIALLVALATSAIAQTASPLLYQGNKLTPAQWIQIFAAKQDYLGVPPLLRTGGTLTGKLTTNASAAGSAGFNLPQGAAPTSPINGDAWTTSAGLFVRINGATVGPLASAAGGPFTGQILDSGATTTSPGWYASITGDTVPRVRVGMNATDVPSIALGPGNANRDTFIERVGVASLRFGSPDAASPVAQIIGVQNVLAGTSNTAGANLTINGSRGTGTGGGGNIVIQIAPVGVSGTSQNALTPAVTIFGDAGGVSIRSPGINRGASSLDVGGAVFSSSSISSAGSDANFNAGGNRAFMDCGGGTCRVGALNGGGSAVSLQIISNNSAAITAAGTAVATPGTLAVGGATIGASTFAVNGNTVLGGTLAVQASSASDLLVQTAGGVTAFQVDTSAVSMATGLLVQGEAAGATVVLRVTSSATNEGALFQTKGTGQFTFGTTSNALTNVNIGNPNASQGSLNIAASVASYQSITVTGTAAAGVASLPIGTYNIVGDTIAATLTNKTLTSPVINVGADATGDIYYRNAGVFTRLPIGSNGNVLQVNTGLPSWQAGSSAGSITQGSTTIGGTCPNGQILFSSSATLGCENVPVTAGAGISITGTTNATIKLALNSATLDANPADPTLTSSATGVMMGLGSTCTITPVYSTRVKVTFDYNMANPGANRATVIGKFGTGAAPANGVAFTGTTFGTTAGRQAAVGAAFSPIPGSNAAIITGLTPSTAYWLDLEVISSASNTTISAVHCTGEEF